MIIKNNEKVIKNNFNVYFSILRMYLSFVVVNNHLFKNRYSNINNKYLLKLLKNRLSVPIFFIMSFFLCYKLFLFKDILKIKRRFERLIIPFIFWPIIFWIFNNLFYFYLNLKLKISFYDLIIQFLTGHNIVAVLWFQLNLIISTFLILLLHKVYNKNIIFILINLEIVSYFFQYSNFNYKFFSQFSNFIKYSYGRLIEIIPFCISGYTFRYLDIINYLKKYEIKTIYYLIILLLTFLFQYQSFVYIIGFMYQGIKLHIISIIIFTLFALNPFENNLNVTFIKIINLFTNYTSGIYYLHIPIWIYLSNFIDLIKKRTFLTSLIIYIICYFISFMGIKIFDKTKIKHLFQ